MKNQLELAVYGKGGIGKSTMSANLTAALSDRGQRVLQIGCDPKHDSTRLLMQGEIIDTVLDYLKNADAAREEVSAVLREGYGGCGCIEAGGPKPGVGCAGRGILSAFEFLRRHNVKEDYDIVVYDVLGDVVCGGFAVPARQEYADAIFLVTSGEYMALYAANNILRGIYNFDGDKRCRVAGIIYNERRVTDEDGRVSRFAEAVGLPICVKVPRSNAFAKAEEQHVTLAQMEGCREEKEVFLQLADRITNGLTLYPARPLSDEELERIVLATERLEERAENIEPAEDDTASEKPDFGRNRNANPDCAEIREDFAGKAGDGQNYSEQDEDAKNGQKVRSFPDHGSFGDFGASECAKDRMPLYGCAFNGAATAAIHLTDAIIIAHAPRACAYYTWQNISSPGRKNLFNRGILMPSALSPNFVSTDIGQSEVVFGGLDLLKEKVAKALEKKPGTIIVISSCVSGIIGDDIKSVEDMANEHTKILTILADGDIAGDYMEGIRMCMHTLAEGLIREDVEKKERCVNIVNETGVSINTKVNEEVIRRILGKMGIGINCRFLGDASTKEMENFLAAPLNILATEAADSLELRDWLKARYDCKFLEGALPIGFAASEIWVRSLGSYFHCEAEAESIILEEKKTHEAEIADLKETLSGKRIILTTINTSLDWFIDSALEAGMEFVFIGVLNYLHMPIHITNHTDKVTNIKEVDDWILTKEMLDELKPDVLLSNYSTFNAPGDYITDAIPMTPVAGFHSALPILKRWKKLLTGPKSNKEEGWKNDEKLFEKYFS